MYLTRLKLDPVLRSTREMIIKPYLLHKAIYRAFPDEDGGGTGRILYRMDRDHENNTNLLIQSEYKPNWDRAEFLKSCLIENLEPPKLFNPVFKSGQILYFRLRANPTVKKQSKDKINGYRLGLLREEDQTNWLRKKATEGGFILIHCQANPEGMIHELQNNGEDKLRHYAVRFEGVLKISDPDIFLETILNGIGSAKGFGFGLLSIAPVRGD